MQTYTQIAPTNSIKPPSVYVLIKLQLFYPNCLTVKSQNCKYPSSLSESHARKQTQSFFSVRRLKILFKGSPLCKVAQATISVCGPAPFVFWFIVRFKNTD